MIIGGCQVYHRSNILNSLSTQENITELTGVFLIDLIRFDINNILQDDLWAKMRQFGVPDKIRFVVQEGINRKWILSFIWHHYEVKTVNVLSLMPFNVDVEKWYIHCRILRTGKLNDLYPLSEYTNDLTVVKETEGIFQKDGKRLEGNSKKNVI